MNGIKLHLKNSPPPIHPPPQKKKEKKWNKSVKPRCINKPLTVRLFTFYSTTYALMQYIFTCVLNTLVSQTGYKSVYNRVIDIVIRSRKPDSLVSRSVWVRSTSLIHLQGERISLLGANYYINDPVIIYLLVKKNIIKTIHY